MSELIAFGFLVFTSFFTLLNPLGVMPVFMTMTAPLTSRQRTRTAKKAVIVAFLTLAIFAFSGEILFKFFGISVDSFRVVGGIIFFMLGYDMLNARLSNLRLTKEEVREYVNDISVTPLAIPMITGPGAITNVIVLMDDANSFQKKIVLFFVLAIVFWIVYLCLWSAARIIRFLGETGNNIMMRLMGLIVMVIAVEFFFSGMSPILKRIIGG
jgi:multiple antibiotic resistance protein